MKVLLAATLLAVPLVGEIPHQTSSREEAGGRTLERPFVTGGRVKLDLAAGEYTLRASPDNHIRLRWSARDSRELDRLRVRADVNGSQAKITTSRSRNHFRFIAELPARTDLDIDLSAGELRLEGITGSMNVEVGAGDLDIELGRFADYKKVDTSVLIGELTLKPLHISKGGFIRSYKWKGPGQHALRARLWVGDLTVRARTAGD